MDRDRKLVRGKGLTDTDLWEWKLPGSWLLLTTSILSFDRAADPQIELGVELWVLPAGASTPNSRCWELY